MNANAHRNWIRGGLAVTLGLAGIFAYRRSWKSARLFGGFALAFAESWRDSRLAEKIGDVLAQARRNP